MASAKEPRDMLILLAGSDLARGRSLMLCLVSEVGRSVDVVGLDALIDGYALKARNAGHAHIFADLASRREALAALVVGGALDAITGRGGHIIGYRITDAAVAHLVGAICSGWVEEGVAPAWLLVIARGAP